MRIGNKLKTIDQRNREKIDQLNKEIYNFWDELSANLEVVDGNYNSKQAKPETIEKYKKDIDALKDKIIKFLKTIEKLDSREYSVWQVSSIVCEFSKYVVGRCPELEKSIITNYKVAKEYVEEMNISQWPEFEKYILEFSEDPHDLYDYASNLDGRWDEFEKRILEMKYTEDLPRVIVNYCCLHKFAFKEAEEIIKKNVDLIVEYARDVLDSRWKEAEPNVLKSMDDAEEYLRIFNFRWPEYEHKIRNKPKRILSYAKEIIKGKLPDELHNRMLILGLKNNYESKYYFDYLKERENDTIAYLSSLSEEERSRIVEKI